MRTGYPMTKRRAAKAEATTPASPRKSAPLTAAARKRASEKEAKRQAWLDEQRAEAEAKKTKAPAARIVSEPPAPKASRKPRAAAPEAPTGKADEVFTPWPGMTMTETLLGSFLAQMARAFDRYVASVEKVNEAQARHLNAHARMAERSK